MGTKYRDESWRNKRQGFRHIPSQTLARWNTEPTEVREPVTVGLNTALTKVGGGSHTQVSDPHQLLATLIKQIGWMISDGVTEENCVDKLRPLLTPEQVNALRAYGIPIYAPTEVARVMQALLQRL